MNPKIAQCRSQKTFYENIKIRVQKLSCLNILGLHSRCNGLANRLELPKQVVYRIQL